MSKNFGDPSLEDPMDVQAVCLRKERIVLIGSAGRKPSDRYIPVKGSPKFHDGQAAKEYFLSRFRDYLQVDEYASSARHYSLSFDEDLKFLFECRNGRLSDSEGE